MKMGLIKKKYNPYVRKLQEGQRDWIK